MSDLIRVSATGRAPGYMPEFVAREFGFFETRGIEVDTVIPHDWEDVLSDIASGKAELALGGIWVPSMYHGRGRELWVTAQLCNRAAFSVVARDSPGADWLADIPGKTVLIPGSGGASLGMFFSLFLSEQGIDPASVRVVKDLDGQMMTELFMGGAGDYLVTGATAGPSLGKNGFHEVIRFVEQGDDIPWSVYYTTPATLKAKGDALQRFNAALDEAMVFMNATPAAEFVPRVTKWYPGVNPDELIALTETMRQVGMWTGTELRPQSYLRWQRGIAGAGLIDEPLAREEVAAPLALGA